jgi:2,4-diaminopentanoate dehydrogenase
MSVKQADERSPIRVVQWTTGNVGRRSVRAIATAPHLELVGCYAWSPDKAGKDAGTLAGIEELGVVATNDASELLTMGPDCVVYNPMWPNVDEVVEILSAGVNVVTTAAFITGHNLGEDRARIEEACQRGEATIFGSGINPGAAQLLAIVSATICDRIDKVSITEFGDSTLYDSPETEKPVGFGQPIDHPGLQAMTASGTSVFREAVLMLADAIGVELDDVRCTAEYAQTTQDLHLPADWVIERGCVAGVDLRWQGFIGGRIVIEIRMRWRKGQTLQPDWQHKPGGYVIEITGQPSVTTTLDFLPPTDFEAKSMSDFMVLGMIITAMPAINAIPAVVAADPGIATYNDLQLTSPRGFVSGLRDVRFP